ncbi:hypothetical protein IGI04_030225 [Brassica rapa subsp. trilocularis]|uniref:SAM-dependent MTase RsmB/NOP-type domain-containing protein n=1 Tax=Brassica rapa subsp. trilocularis TaxID=1813537 RepID=A0ABQ7LQ31_BRACM|nr:hypothetical protein IGI04_030225 [Brassica rapa subsp. trilocularis]
MNDLLSRIGSSTVVHRDRIHKELGHTIDLSSHVVKLDYLSPNVRPQLSLVGHEKVLIDPTTGCGSIHLSARRSMQLVSCRSTFLLGSVTHGFNVFTRLNLISLKLP